MMSSFMMSPVMMSPVIGVTVGPAFAVPRFGPAIDVLSMAPRWQYLAVLAFCIIATLPLEVVFGARVYRQPGRAAISIAAGAVPFIVWDYFATRAGHWWFSDSYTLGARIAGLPIEELLFFVVVPLCGLLTYEVVGILWGRRKP